MSGLKHLKWFIYEHPAVIKARKRVANFRLRRSSTKSTGALNKVLCFTEELHLITVSIIIHYELILLPTEEKVKTFSKIKEC